MQRSSLRDILLNMPKLDLHCHLNGSARPETLFKIAKKYGFKLPTDNIEEFRKLVCVSPDCRSLTDFLKTFEFFYDFLRFPDAVETIAYELCEDSAKENIVYLEIRFGPSLQIGKNFTEEDVLKAVINGVKSGEKEFGIKTRLILCIYRGLDDEKNEITLKLAEKYIGNYVAGIDLAGDEANYPIELYEKFLTRANKIGIPITCHAGESGSAENIEKALKCGARRIGHGVKLLENKDLFNRIMEQKIPLEICLTSNIQTRVVKDYSSHPFYNFYKLGLLVTLNTDDRGVSNIDLTHEYEIAMNEYKLKFQDMKKIVLNSVDATFLDEDNKNKIKKLIFDYDI